MNYFETLLQQHAALAEQLLAGLPQQTADGERSLPAQGLTESEQAASRGSAQAYAEAVAAARGTQALTETAQMRRTDNGQRSTQADTKTASARRASATTAQALVQETRSRTPDELPVQSTRTASQVFDEAYATGNAQNSPTAQRLSQCNRTQERTVYSAQQKQSVTGNAFIQPQLLRADAALFSRVFERDARRYG